MRHAATSSASRSRWTDPVRVLFVALLAGCSPADPGAGAPPRPAAPADVERAPGAVFPTLPPPLGRTRPFPEERPRRRRQRAAMVKDQLRAIGVTDVRVLDAMAAVPRHRFVPAELVESAYDDSPLPIGYGQTISAPDVVGYMTQALGVGPGDRVLDVGTGSGYQAAVLAEMGCRVWSLETVEELAADAAARLEALGYAAVTVRAGDGWHGWPEEAPFDAIVVAAAPDRVPPALVRQLAPGGRLILPVGPEGEVQVLTLVTRDDDGTVHTEETLRVRFVPMTGDPGE